MKSHLYSIQVRQRLHVGVGSGIGVIDMPIVRETSTGIPYVPGSSLKGVLRGAVADTSPDDVFDMFGPETSKASEHAGAIQFSDAVLVALPVRSFSGIFALVTSPYLLSRLKRTLDFCGYDTGTLTSIEMATNEVVIHDGSKLSLEINDARSVVFEDFRFAIREDDLSHTWSNVIAKYCGVDQTFINQHLCIVHDDIMDFLMTNSTEIQPGIRLNPQTKTVETGALWYAEFLPSETILVGCLSVQHQSLGSQKLRSEQMTDKLFPNSAPRVLTIGGKTNTGAGICRLDMYRGE